MEVYTIGFDKCLAKFDALIKAPESLKPVITAQTAKIQGLAKKYYAPRRSWDLPEDPEQKVTGELKRSIKRKTIVGKGHITGVVSTSQEYAMHQEFGTSKMKARPFMRPSARALKKDTEKALRKALEDNLKKAIQ